MGKRNLIRSHFTTGRSSSDVTYSPLFIIFHRQEKPEMLGEIGHGVCSRFCVRINQGVRTHLCGCPTSSSTAWKCVSGKCRCIQCDGVTPRPMGDDLRGPEHPSPRNSDCMEREIKYVQWCRYSEGPTTVRSKSLITSPPSYNIIK